MLVYISESGTRLRSKEMPWCPRRARKYSSLSGWTILPALRDASRLLSAMATTSGRVGARKRRSLL